MADDVLIVGAGPAGAIAATVLARAGARVRIVDRSALPRDKLCGDSINPGALAILRRLDVADEAERDGVRLDGMLLTGEAGRRIVAVEGRYRAGVHGRSIGRRELDWALVEHALRAGAALETGVAVREPLFSEKQGRQTVCGVTTGTNGTSRALRAPIIIAADGRTSSLAHALGLSRHPPAPRRWAIGAYLEAPGNARLGEMHVRRGRYIGVAPLPGNLINVCLVKPSGAGDPDLRRPEALLRRELEADRLLRDRLAGARMARPPIVLGPLAVDATAATVDGLIPAGDAAGFIDPMTGDGLRFALRGGELAAQAALRALEGGWSGVHAWLARERKREFGAKFAFNRIVRRVAEAPRAVYAAALLARVAAGPFERIIRYAGDCGVAIDAAIDGHAAEGVGEDARRPSPRHDPAGR